MIIKFRVRLKATALPKKAPLKKLLKSCPVFISPNAEKVIPKKTKKSHRSVWSNLLASNKFLGYNKIIGNDVIATRTTAI